VAVVWREPTVVGGEASVEAFDLVSPGLGAPDGHDRRLSEDSVSHLKFHLTNGMKIGVIGV
jgi:hypothetical protein